MTDLKSAALVGQIGDAPDNLRARDVEFRLRSHLAPEVVRVIAELAERNFQTQKAVTELAGIVDQVIDNHVGILRVAENMKEAIGTIRKNNEDQEQVPDIATH